MLHAVRKTVRIGPAGRIELQDAALPEGKDAEVIVLVPEPSGDGSGGAPPPPAGAEPSASGAPVAKMLSADELAALPPLPLDAMIGAAPSGRTAEEVDRYLRDLRDEWD